MAKRKAAAAIVFLLLAEETEKRSQHEYLGARLGCKKVGIGGIHLHYDRVGRCVRCCERRRELYLSNIHAALIGQSELLYEFVDQAWLRATYPPTHPPLPWNPDPNPTLTQTLDLSQRRVQGNGPRPCKVRVCLHWLGNCTIKYDLNLACKVAACGHATEKQWHAILRVILHRVSTPL